MPLASGRTAAAPPGMHNFERDEASWSNVRQKLPVHARSCVPNLLLALGTCCTALVNRHVSFSTARPTVVPVVLDSHELPVRQSSYEPPPAGRPVLEFTSEMRRQNWLAAAEAR